MERAKQNSIFTRTKMKEFMTMRFTNGWVLLSHSGRLILANDNYKKLGIDLFKVSIGVALDFGDIQGFRADIEDFISMQVPKLLKQFIIVLVNSTESSGYFRCLICDQGWSIHEKTDTGHFHRITFTCPKMCGLK